MEHEAHNISSHRNTFKIFYSDVVCPRTRTKITKSHMTVHLHLGDCLASFGAGITVFCCRFVTISPWRPDLAWFWNIWWALVVNFPIFHFEILQYINCKLNLLCANIFEHSHLEQGCSKAWSNMFKITRSTVKNFIPDIKKYQYQSYE